MTDAFVLELARGAIWTAVTISAPLLGVALVVGVAVSLFQATTQIHDMTLTYVPKLAGMILVLLVLAPWMLDRLVRFAATLFLGLAELGP